MIRIVRLILCPFGKAPQTAEVEVLCTTASPPMIIGAFSRPVVLSLLPVKIGPQRLNGFGLLRRSADEAEGSLFNVRWSCSALITISSLPRFALTSSQTQAFAADSRLQECRRRPS